MHNGMRVFARRLDGMVRRRMLRLASHHDRNPILWQTDDRRCVHGPVLAMQQLRTNGDFIQTALRRTRFSSHKLRLHDHCQRERDRKRPIQRHDALLGKPRRHLIQHNQSNTILGGMRHKPISKKGDGRIRRGQMLTAPLRPRSHGKCRRSAALNEMNPRRGVHRPGFLSCCLNLGLPAGGRGVGGWGQPPSPPNAASLKRDIGRAIVRR
jgi:hypothetical protein